jgi:hypothetical protein
MLYAPNINSKPKQVPSKSKLKKRKNFRYFKMLIYKSEKCKSGALGNSIVKITVDGRLFCVPLRHRPGSSASSLQLDKHQ